MKIAIFSALYPPYSVGGAERSTFSLVQGLVELGHELEVFSLSPSRQLTISTSSPRRIDLPIPWWDSHGQPFGRVRSRRLVPYFLYFFDHRSHRLLHNYLLRAKFDIIHFSHFPGFHPAHFKICSKLNVPLVLTARDYFLLGDYSGSSSTSYISNIRAYTKRRLNSAALKHADAIVTNSHRMLEIFESKLSHRLPQLRKVIYTNPPTELYQKAFSTDSKQKIIFGYIGELSRLKGVNLILEWFTRRNRLNEELIIGGDGELRELVKSTQIKNPSVKFLGSIHGPEKLRFWRDIDILIQGSVWEEPFSRVINEAFSQSVLVFASRVGGNIEQLGNGSRGVLFSWSEGNLNALLDHAINNPDICNCMLQESRKFLENQIQDGGNSKRYFHFYEKVILQYSR